MESLSNAASALSEAGNKPEVASPSHPSHRELGVVPGLVWAFWIDADGTATALPVGQPMRIGRGGWLWLHVNLVGLRETEWLDCLGLPAAAIALLTGRDHHQQLHAQGDCVVYGVFTDLVRRLDGPADEIAHLHFIMTEHLLISGRHQALCSAGTTREVLSKGMRRLPSVAALLELIVEHAAEAIDRLANTIAADLDRIEDDLARQGWHDERARLSALRRTSVSVHRHLTGLRALFHRLEHDRDQSLKPALRFAAGKLAQRFDALDHSIIEMRDRATLLQEEITNMVVETSNKSLQILTVITTLVLPLNFITGVFGMNTKGLPFSDNEDAFLWACLLMVIAVGCVYVVLKRLKLW